MSDNPLRTAHASLPSRLERSNVTQVLRDRLMVSEAIDVVIRMLRGYVNKDKADNAYIGAIAELLMGYPRAVALKCADPFRGVVSTCKFMPTPADIIAWCERACSPLHHEADRERRVLEQLAAREEFKEQVVGESLKEKGRAWLDRTDPVAKELSGQATRQNLADQARADLIKEFGEETFNAVPDATAGYFKKLSVEI